MKHTVEYNLSYLNSSFRQSNLHGQVLTRENILETIQ